MDVQNLHSIYSKIDINQSYNWNYGNTTHCKERKNDGHTRIIQYIQRTKLENQINDKSTITQNIIFDTLIQKHTSRGHPSLPTQPEQHEPTSFIIQHSADQQSNQESTTTYVERKQP